MLKQLLTAASLAVLLAGHAHAAAEQRRDNAVPERAEREAPRETRKKAPPPVTLPPRADPGDSSHRRSGGPDRDRDRDRERGSPPGADRGHRDDVRPILEPRDANPRNANPRGVDLRRDDHDERERGHGNGNGWRDDDRHRDLREHDWRRDDDWRRLGWVYQGGRNDGWRYYRGHDHRHWRCVPPYRYSFDFGYRWGYELAWRDWLAFGRFDRYWSRPGYGYGGGYGYSAGYDAGWQDAAFYYSRGYRPDYWAYDPQGGWYFSFRISG